MEEIIPEAWTFFFLQILELVENLFTESASDSEQSEKFIYFHILMLTQELKKKELYQVK
jgi:hypothetical protein